MHKYLKSKDKKDYTKYIVESSTYEKIYTLLETTSYSTPDGQDIDGTSRTDKIVMVKRFLSKFNWNVVKIEKDFGNLDDYFSYLISIYGTKPKNFVIDKIEKYVKENRTTYEKKYDRVENRIDRWFDRKRNESIISRDIETTSSIIGLYKRLKSETPSGKIEVNELRRANKSTSQRKSRSRQLYRNHRQRTLQRRKNRSKTSKGKRMEYYRKNKKRFTLTPIKKKHKRKYNT